MKFIGNLFLRQLLAVKVIGQAWCFSTPILRAVRRWCMTWSASRMATACQKST